MFCRQNNVNKSIQQNSTVRCDKGTENQKHTSEYYRNNYTTQQEQQHGNQEHR